MYLPTDPGCGSLDDVSQDSFEPDTMIIASYHKDKIVELCELNKHRTSYAHSIASYDLENNALFSVNRGYGDLSYNKLYDDAGLYTIVFIQTPPCGRNIQPPCIFSDPPSDHHLWFNGELKPNEIEKLQIIEDTTETWPAYLLLKHIIRYGAPVDVDGAFACMYCDGRDLFLFRNDNEALFFDNDFTICSTPFVGSTSLPPNKVYKMNMKKNKLKKIEEFQTVRHWYPKE